MAVHVALYYIYSVLTLKIGPEPSSTLHLNHPLPPSALCLSRSPLSSCLKHLQWGGNVIPPPLSHMSAPRSIIHLLQFLQKALQQQVAFNFLSHTAPMPPATGQEEPGIGHSVSKEA